MFKSRKSSGGTTPTATESSGEPPSQNSSPERIPQRQERRAQTEPSIQMQVMALREQMDQVQLNAINYQAQVENRLKAALDQLETATEQLKQLNENGAGSPFLKTSTAVRGLVAALIVLYVQKSIISKPVSKLQYSKAMRHIHLLMGVGVLGGIGTAQAAKRLEPGPEKKTLMELHKSSGLVMLLGMILRVVFRFRSGIPERFPGPRPLQFLETLSHRGFYVLMLALPVSGLAYTYFSGVGMPIVGVSKAELEEDDADKAQQAIDLHKRLGQFLEYAWVPFHFATLSYHSARGRSVVKRITPFP